MALDVDRPCRLYLGTGDGLRTARLSQDGAEVTAAAVGGNAVRAIDVHPSDPSDAFVGCGLRGWGLYHTTDGGATATSLGFEDEWVWGLARHPDDPETVYVGTEPPMLYVSRDGGETFEALDGIDALPSRDEWTFFHAPFHAGHVHGVEVHPDRPERILAGVEHGALVVSQDGGDTWRETLVGSDVHRVASHPEDPDRVYAATGSGLYRSDDGAHGWEQVEDLAGAYVHAVRFHPEDPRRQYVYATDDDCPVYRSDDGGASWNAVGAGLPAGRAADALRLHPHDPETVVYAGEPERDTGRLYVSTDAGDTWTRLEPSLPKVWRMEAVPVP